MEVRPLHPAARRAIDIQSGLVLADLASHLVNSYLTARQLSDVVRLVPLSLSALRLEIVITFWPRVIDMPEMYRVMFALTVQERRELVHRLGILNLLDPLNLDGDYVLNLKFRDHRVMTGILAHLVLNESSSSFRGVGGRGNPDFNSIQGWKLPSSWLDQIPREGILRVHYSSTAPGVVINWDERRELCRQVLTYC